MPWPPRELKFDCSWNHKSGDTTWCCCRVVVGGDGDGDGDGDADADDDDDDADADADAGDD